jgi:hypothetical protein
MGAAECTLLARRREDEMGIRKYGAADGQVTGTEPGDGFTREAARGEGWGPADDQELAAENAAAGQDDDD